MLFSFKVECFHLLFTLAVFNLSPQFWAQDIFIFLNVYFCILLIIFNSIHIYLTGCARLLQNCPKTYGLTNYS